MKSSPHLTQPILLGKQKFTIAVFVGKCYLHLALLIDTCSFILERDLSHVKYADKHLQQMETCIDIEEPIISATHVKVMGLVDLPAKKLEKGKTFGPLQVIWVGVVAKAGQPYVVCFVHHHA